ncbi:MAG TPA: carboxypeptidase regulatory-like domain-containing protein, partial [Gammaproteobacteria bacterium]|nr:carboxypeptidase regulatory-like domain-containing protein [Gammaproteobacteria bacterium]
TTPAPVTTGYLQGVVLDSVHAEPLIHALISLEGSARMTFSDSLGRFLVDSIPPGSYRVMVEHPMLDTLGIQLVTPPMSVSANMVTQTVIAVPSGEFLVSLFCPAARRALGPGALVGRVREPDSDSAAVGARVSFVWYDADPPGLPANLRVTKKPPRVREATVGEDGIYRLCGLPEKYEGKLQAQRKDGGETAEVTVTQELGRLALRSMSVAARPKIAAGDTGAVQQPRGSARVSGVVVNRGGAPVANARVGLMGSSAATMTKSNGEFILDSLPAGTQALVVRQIGYSPTEVPVELSSRTPARVTVKLGVLVPQLSPVEVISRREEGLQKVGFLDRKRTSAGGYFITPEDL